MIQWAVRISEARNEGCLPHTGITEHNNFVEWGLRCCGGGSVRHGCGCSSNISFHKFCGSTAALSEYNTCPVEKCWGGWCLLFFATVAVLFRALFLSKAESRWSEPAQESTYLYAYVEIEEPDLKARASYGRGATNVYDHIKLLITTYFWYPFPMHYLFLPLLGAWADVPRNCL